jgi:hypothetical protein
LSAAGSSGCPQLIAQRSWGSKLWCWRKAKRINTSAIHAITGGTLHVCMSDIRSGEDTLLGKIKTICADVARPNLARAVAKDAERSVRWLQGKGYNS